jgi:pimeloyl-ACP methyl ester carboxylesterase
MHKAVLGAIAAMALLFATLAQASAESVPACRPSDSGRLLRFDRVASYPTAASTRTYFSDWVAFYQELYQFPRDLPVTFAYGFDSYKVTYCTTDALLPGDTRPRPTVGTGMVAVPRKSGHLATVVYQRGTAVSFYDTPSNPNIVGPLEARGESFEGPPASAVFAGNGFIYVAPDFLGFGDSTVPRHRYFHAATEAESAVDLLTASRRLLTSLSVQRSDQLFVFGFSQGGHAALALHRQLQDAHIDVTGTATIGGIFDVEQWFLSLLARDNTNTLPLYAAYLLLAYDDIYNVYERPTDVFRQPYASTVGGLFDMHHFWDDVLAEMPPTTRALLTPAYYARITANRNDPFRVRLRQNTVDQWRPRAPIRVYQSPSDEEAPYADALASVARLRSRGADVTVRSLPDFDHVNSWIQAMPQAVTWFRSLDGR